MKTGLRWCVLLLAVGLAARHVAAESSVKIAAAASLAGVLPELASRYAATGGGKVEFVFGASGAMVTAIRQGAPYDAFISADMGFPQRLHAERLAAEVPRPVARGVLTLWIAQSLPGVTNLSDLAGNSVRRIAVANPETAPYGAAAMDALKRSLVYPAVSSRLVRAESVAQVNQFAASGNVDAAFMSASSKDVAALATSGYWIDVPAELHRPLDHGAVLLVRGGGRTASAVAEDFLHFLVSEKSRDVWRQFGYVPADEPAAGDHPVR